MTLDIAGSVCVVTGAASGIGACTARALVESGGRVVLCDIRRDSVDELADQLRRDGGEVRSYAVDVASFEQMNELGIFVERELGPADVLVNNAGVLEVGSLLDTGVDEFRRVVEVNYFGAFYGMKVFLPSMVKKGRGAVVNIASASGVVGTPTIAAYSSSKFALVGLSAAARAEVGPRGVSVSTVCPGLVNTSLADNAPLPEQTRDRVRQTLQRSGIAPEVVAAAIVRAIRRGKGDVHVGWDARVISVLDRLAPSQASRILARFVK